MPAGAPIQTTRPTPPLPRRDAVGGGTGTPTARECLALLGCVGEGTAPKLAEIAGALVLAGEISIAAALTSGDFTRAHATLGRRTGASVNEATIAAGPVTSSGLSVSR